MRRAGLGARVLAVGGCLVAAAGCDSALPPPEPTVTVEAPDGFGPMPVPTATPLTVARVDLGERLFFDPMLSRDRSVSCASCHLPELAFSDGRPVSTGVDGRTGFRNAPGLLNVGYERALFHDGGALFLETQALVPLEDPNEMDLAPEDAVARLAAHAEYPALFRAAFGEGPTVQTMARALAAFQRTLVSAPVAWDRYRAGDADALAPTARAGEALFQTHCASCHAGPRLTSGAFENNGAATDDSGRARITGDPADTGRFRVASLRAVARTAPYFHDGRFATLAEVVAHYDRGGDGTPGQSPAVRPLHLTQPEREALVAFLATFTDTAASPHRGGVPRPTAAPHRTLRAAGDGGVPRPTAAPLPGLPAR